MYRLPACRVVKITGERREIVTDAMVTISATWGVRDNLAASDPNGRNIVETRHDSKTPWREMTAQAWADNQAFRARRQARRNAAITN